jgi:hypothetical protein
LQGDDDRVGIPEDAADVGLGNEAREPIQVLEELEFGHRQSMTRIPQEGKSRFLRKSRSFYGFEVKNYPLESPKSQKNISTKARAQEVPRAFLPHRLRNGTTIPL